MILCDTREQKNAHVIAYFDRHNISYDIRTVHTGDYMDSEKMDITVDRKQNLEELSGNLCTKNNRFWREVRRSKEEGLKMVVLCEHGGKIRSIKDVANWKSKYSRVGGKRLMEEIYRVHIAYDVDFYFCDKRSTGRRILEILGEKQRRERK